MMPFWKKAFSVFVLAAFVLGGFVFPQPKNAHAFLGIDWCGQWFICLNPVGDPAAVTSAGANTVTAGATPVTAGATTAKLVVDGTPVERAVTDVLLTPTVCDSFANANLLLDSLDSVGNALAGADKAKMSNTFFISYKVESTRSQLRDCWMPLEIVAQSAKGATNSQAQNLEANRALIANKKQTLTLQLTDYEKQKKESFTDVFEAIGFNFALEAYKQVTIKGVNEVVDKLKINNYGKYIDALATQVYSIDYIKKNFSKDKQRELIAASLFRNQALGDITGLSNAVTLAQQKSKQYKVDPASLNWGNNNFWGRVSGAADERVWPEYHMLTGRSDASQAIASGRETARSGTAGKGFKDVRNCNDVTAQQAQIDTDLAAAGKKLEETEIAAALLQLSESNAYDIAAAQSEYDAAAAEYKRVQDNSHGGLAEAGCAVLQPAEFVARTTSDWLKSFIDQNTDIKTTNVSLFGSLAGKLANTLFKDIIQGRGGSALNDLGSSLIPLGISAGLQGAINAGSQGASGNDASGPAGGGSPLPVVGDNATVTFTYTSAPNNKIVLNVKFEASDDVIPKSLRIAVAEVGNPANTTAETVDILPGDFKVTNGLITGAVVFDDVRPAKNSTYTVTLRGIKRSVGVSLLDLVSSTITVSGGSVAGAYTFLPRGPEPFYNYNY